MTDNIKTNPTLLLVDDDEVFCQVLSQALHARHINVLIAHTVAEALDLVGNVPPKYAIVDLNMPGDSGLKLIDQLHQMDASICMIVLTGFASIATAVEAIKLGATHYLAKPADADEILAALGKEDGDINTTLPLQPMSTKRLEWEHIQKVLSDSNGNISEAARKLDMHRRTLQRKLNNKRPPSASSVPTTAGFNFS
ncbi:MAG: two-component system response regulator [Zetaproteobacteria bacterium CG2_30_46_52]|nr:MAG: two-component system response regulator [Zetaproteobacteria bacterium CG2_30_46_52]